MYTKLITSESVNKYIISPLLWVPLKWKTEKWYKFINEETGEGPQELRHCNMFLEYVKQANGEKETKDDIF